MPNLHGGTLDIILTVPLTINYYYFSIEGWGVQIWGKKYFFFLLIHLLRPAKRLHRIGWNCFSGNLFLINPLNFLNNFTNIWMMRRYYQNKPIMLIPKCGLPLLCVENYQRYKVVWLIPGLSGYYRTRNNKIYILVIF